jgi:hypothetical protein
MKICKRCLNDKNLEEFPYRKSSKDKRRNICNPCAYKDMMSKYKTAQERAGRRSILKNRYNLTQEEYDLLLKNQNNTCAICDTKENVSKKGSIFSLGVDHNHVSGKNRGLLCHRCNSGIGHLKDSILLLKKAIKYLSFYEK